MNQGDKTALLATIDEGLAQLGPSRPSVARVTKARSLFNEVRVACQNIPISPVTDGGVITPPTPGPEQPPIEPAPPDPPPSGGGGGGTTSPPTTTTVTTTYTSQGDFSGSQGNRGWYYLSENESEMTYSSGQQLWSGTELYQVIWSTGQHPGGINGAMRRWVAQGTGTFAITGHIFDSDTSSAGNAVTVRVKQNGVAIYTQVIADQDTVGYTPNLTGSCVAGDTFDFLVNGNGGVNYASTGLTVSIALTTTTTSGGGSTTQTALPFTLNGTAPEEGTYTITANKPSNADGCTIDITGVNYDTAYGRIYFNGSTNSLAIWPTAPGNAGISATVSLAVPLSYVVNGSNTLRFTHDSGAGYTVTAIAAPVFTTPTTPTPPATQTSLPFDLRGSILPEDGILTLSLSKPSNANGATMTVTGVNLTGLQGSYYINGTLASAIWTDAPALAGVSSTVTRNPLHTLFVNGNNTIRFVHTEGTGYTVSAVNVSFSTPTPGTDPGPPTGNNGAFGNEPAGMTTILNHPFNVAAGPNMLDVYNSTQIVSDASAPLSPSNVARHRLEAFAKEGGGQLHYTSPTRYRELFVGLWWRCNPEWQGRIVQDKLFFVRGLDGSPFGSNGLFEFDGSPTQGRPMVLIWAHNSGNVDNSHLGVGAGENLQPNVGSGVVTPGVWTKIEANVRCSTTLTSRDGFVKWWINGQPVGSYIGNNYGSAAVGLFEWVWTETWDRSGDMGTSNTVAWEHYMDHLYISGKN